MIKAIIFDFDGVILESADIKTRAFGKLFEKEYPEKVDEILEYHTVNMGISRYVKFRYIYTNILNKKLNSELEKQLGERFSDIVLNEILKAPFVDGILEFLKANYQKIMFFIASGTPIEELKYITDKRCITDYFTEIHGSPKTKTQVINDVIEKYGFSKNEILFLGDAESDVRAAKETNINFILRRTNENGYLKDDNLCIADFISFESYLGSPEK